MTLEGTDLMEKYHAVFSEKSKIIYSIVYLGTTIKVLASNQNLNIKNIVYK